MQKLSKENIQFIENYLENSDIRYADIRMEMTDHVASAIETEMQKGDQRGFYFIFKDYMVAHKSKLLANNKKFIRSTDMSILKNLGKQLIRPFSVLFFALMALVIFKLLDYIETKSLRTLISAIPILSIIPFFTIYLSLLKKYKLSRFSGVERLGLAQVIMFYCYDFITSIVGYQIKTSPNDLFTAMSLALIVTISLAMIRLIFITVNQYRCEYQII